MSTFSPERLVEARGTTSQDEFAKKLGISTRTLIRYEGGQGEPTASRLAAIAAATGRPLEFFFRSGNRARRKRYGVA